MEEWFYERSYHEDAFKQIFSRKDSFVDYFGDDTAIRGLLPTVAQSPGTLFLHLAGKTSVFPFAAIFNWCEFAIKSSDITGSNNKGRFDDFYESFMAMNSESRSEFLEFIKKFDPSIIDLDLPSEAANISEANKNIYIVRRNIDSDEIGFSINMESDGTKKIFEMYLSLRDVLDNGGLYIVDELDLRLHPRIVRTILSLFHDDQENKNAAQLIFSSHSTACLNGQDLRLDEIYFTEKDETACSLIYRVKSDGETVMSPDADFGKYYLLGHLGATPTGFIKGGRIRTDDEFECKET